MIITLFIVLQSILLLLITLHDWVHIPPLTDIRALEQHSTFKGRVINSVIFFMLVFIPLMLTVVYQQHFPWWVKCSLVSCYGLMLLGTIITWWIPYLFGGYFEGYKAGFIEYKHTHHFLPARGDNIIPNTFHVVMHLFVWSCFALALYISLRQ